MIQMFVTVLKLPSPDVFELLLVRSIDLDRFCIAYCGRKQGATVETHGATAEKVSAGLGGG